MLIIQTTRECQMLQRVPLLKLNTKHSGKSKEYKYQEISMAKITYEFVKEIYDLIVDCPGVSVGDISRGLGVSVARVKNGLIALDRYGLYVSEKDGRLYPFEIDYIPDLSLTDHERKYT